jgi:peptidoglycan/xylan/chitin deacetylase (PgdA/CDA1 family)
VTTVAGFGPLGRFLSVAVAGLLAVSVAGCAQETGVRHAAVTSASPEASVDPGASPQGSAAPQVTGGASARPSPRPVGVPPTPGPKSGTKGRIGGTRPGTVPPVISHGPRTRKRIALTFDSNMTDSMVRRIATAHTDYANEKVVAELQQLNVPATFFLASKWIEAYPALTRQIVADQRFEVASHSWAHAGFRPRCYGLDTLRPDQMAADVEKSFDVLDRYAPNATRYFRFPGGCYDQTALEAIAPVGCTVIQYDVASGDAFGTSPRAIIDTTLSRSQSGSIVVLHITEANAPFTDEALPTIVKTLRARGYELVTLSDLLAG